MADIPRAVLSEQFEKHLDGRRLLAAVFVTFRLDPEFFEQQVLPVFIPIPTSHAEAIKRVQLEQELRDVTHRIAVYYDQNGLAPDAKAARLDIARIAVSHKTGIFHPKNVFALVESKEADDEGYRARALIVGCMSANLTRAGWWENVEVCHIEEIAEGDATRLKEDLYGFLDGLERRVGEKASDGQTSLKAIKAFLRSTDQRLVRSSGGWLHTHFFDGSTSVREFLRTAAGSALTGLYLEVISPYFDLGPKSKPLSDLIEEFGPREVRVFLPRNDTGAALCSSELFDWMRNQPRVSWGRLPAEVTLGGKSKNARSRMVHAKVYRFFQANPKREYLFVGSVNLTDPAHRRGGNLETGFLVELESPRRPDWWLEVERSKPAIYQPHAEDDGAVSTAGSRLSLRYRWDVKQVEAYWDDEEPGPPLRVTWNRESLFELGPLAQRRWVTLSSHNAIALERVLQSTSIVKVEGDRSEPTPILVQEEGMAHRPSVLFDLTPAEILRYWALLSAEQRAAFLEAHAPEVALTSGGAELLAKHIKLVDHESFFDRFAGIFISFGQLERHVRESLERGNTRAAVYRLFGQQYDSLGRLLKRVEMDNAKGQDGLVEHYVMALCARQMVEILGREQAEFFRAHAAEVKQLEELLRVADTLRGALVNGGDPGMADFLDWFEKWFLRRAQPVEHEGAYD